MAKLLLDEDLITRKDNEEIQGETLFSLREIFLGILVGGKDFVDEVNEAIDLAYAEK